MKPHPIFFDHGAGPRLIDVDGNSYLDYVLGWGPVILGHGHAGLTAAVADQIPRGATFGSGHVLEALAAEKVVERIPGVDRVLWTNTGSEANQVALRLARAATGRQRFVKFRGHYHGWTDAFLLGYRPDGAGSLGLGSRGQSAEALAAVTMVDWGDLAALETELVRPGADIAAVFMEPILVNSGVVEPPPGFLAAVRDLCDRTGIVLVFDEVITGFRVARGGAVERYGVQPDLVVLAKAIAGGYPLAAVAGRADLIDLVEAGVVHAGTYNGNPVSLAAACATLDALDAPGTYDDFERRGRSLAAGLAAAMVAEGFPVTVTSAGPVVQLIPMVDDARTFDEFLAADERFYSRLSVELLSRGVFVMPGGRWYISTAHTDDDIATTTEVFADAVRAVNLRSN
jgi:glutamate-1-semialdehyde 2,1-aminomutase